MKTVSHINSKISITNKNYCREMYFGKSGALPKVMHLKSKGHCLETNRALRRAYGFNLVTRFPISSWSKVILTWPRDTKMDF